MCAAFLPLWAADRDYVTDAANKGVRIAVLEPKGNFIPESRKSDLVLLQQTLTADFNTFSEMTVIDRVHLDKVLAEQKLSASGNFSDKDFISIGNLTQARYVLAGSLTQIAGALYSLELAIIDAETGERRVSFGPKQYPAESIRNMAAAKEGAYDLLTKMGVRFSAAGREALYRPAEEAAALAQTALAKGVAAQKSGATAMTNVETMYYMYEARAFSPALLEASERLARLKDELRMPVMPAITEIAPAR